MSDLTSSSRRLLDLDVDFDVEFDSETLASLALSGQPFDVDGAVMRLGGVEFRSKSPGDVSFGLGSPIRLQVSANAEMRKDLSVVWDASGMSAAMREELGDALDFSKQAAIALELDARAGVVATGGSPIARYFAVSGRAEANGGLAYFHYLPFEKSRPAREVMAEFFNSLRWPLQREPSKAEIACPAVTGVALRSSLELWGQVTAGYEARGSKSVDIKGLNPEFLYQARVGATLAARLSLGGAFAVSSRAGRKPGWTRLQVRRARSRGFESKFGLDVNAGFKVEGLSSNPDELLGALTGINLTSAFEWVEEVANAGSWEDVVERLRTRFGTLVAENGSEFFEEIVGGKSFESLQEMVNGVLLDLQEFRDEADRRVLELSKRYQASAGEVVARIDSILEKTSRERLMELSDPATWKLVESLVGQDLYALLDDQSLFAAMQSKLRKLRGILSGAPDYLSLGRYIEHVEKRLNVDKLIDRIGVVSNKTEFKQLMVGEAGKFAQKLFDFTSTEIGKPAVYRRVKESANKLIRLRSGLAAELEKGFARKVELSVSASYASQRSSESLVDVEIDLETAAGRAIYEKAIEGDFAYVLSRYNESCVLVRGGSFQRSLSESKELRVHAFGWGRESVSQARQIESSKIVQQGNGTVFLFDSQTGFETKYRKGYGLKELTMTAYNLRAQAQSLLDKGGAGVDAKTSAFYKNGVIDLASDYHVTQSDRKPEWMELASYLKFAAQLGITESAEILAAELHQEFAEDTPVSFDIKYTVRYSENAFENVFINYDEELRDMASAAFRQYFSDRYYCSGRSFFSEESLRSYLGHSWIEELRWSGRHHNGRKRYRIYDSNGNSVTLQNGNPLYEAYAAETRFKNALMQLDLVLDSIFEDRMLDERHLDSLNGALMALVSIPKDGGNAVWKENLFFLVMDVLQRSVDPDARSGRTVMQLDLAFENREAVRRFYAV